MTSLKLVLATLPATGPVAPAIIPTAPKPYWSWERIPQSYHGASKDRTFTDVEVEHLAKYQMTTIEKWYTPCASKGPKQGDPSCAVESKIEHLFSRIRAVNPNITTILYWNTMFDFSFYAAHQKMLDLEAEGKHAFLRDQTGKVISLCNDGNVYCNITTFDWTQPHVRELWVGTVVNATKTGLVDGIFADHSANEGTAIGNKANNKQAPNQLCNGRGAGRSCYNFTDSFRDEFNSWHLWATNYTQDILSKSTGGPVIQGPLASMNTLGTIVDPSYCDFDAIRRAQDTSGQAVFEARGPCKPSGKCLAAFLAAAEPGTYMHCLYNGDDLVKETSFPEMDYRLGAPNGTARETPTGSDIWRRYFASGTIVEWNNKKKTGTVKWAKQPPSPPAPTPTPPAVCGKVLADTGMASAEIAVEKTATLGECCTKCGEKKGCAIYAWHFEEGGHCHFHSDKAKENPGIIGCYSGYVNSTGLF